jgi:hypothetical protein
MKFAALYDIRGKPARTRGRAALGARLGVDLIVVGCDRYEQVAI